MLTCPCFQQMFLSTFQCPVSPQGVPPNLSITHLSLLPTDVLQHGHLSVLFISWYLPINIQTLTCHASCRSPASWPPSCPLYPLVCPISSQILTCPCFLQMSCSMATSLSPVSPGIHHKWLNTHMSPLPADVLQHCHLPVPCISWYRLQVAKH